MKWRVFIVHHPHPDNQRQFIGNVVFENRKYTFHPAEPKADRTWLNSIKRHVLSRCEHWDRKFSSSWDEETFIEITSI